MKKNKSFSNFISEGGLWDNIRKARAAGKPKKKPGQKGYPKTLDIESKEAYEPITTKRAQAFAKADAEPRKKVTLPRAPWDKNTKVNTKGTNVTYDKNGKVVKEDAYDSPAKKKPVSQMSSAEKKANDERRKAYKDFQKSKRIKTEGAMKRMASGDGLQTFKKKPAETDLEKTRRMAKNNMKPAATKPSKRPDDEMREASKEGATKIIKTKDNMAQVQRMTKGKFVNHGKPYKSAKDAEKVRSSGQHSMQFSHVQEAGTAEKYASKDKRAADGGPTAAQKAGAAKFHAANKLQPGRPKSAAQKDKIKDQPMEAFSSRAIVKKPRAGDGKPMSDKPIVRNSPEHKAAVKKHISGMKSNRPASSPMDRTRALAKKDMPAVSKLPRQMKDPKKDAMVSKGNKTIVVDKSKEKDHLKKGYVRAEHMISKELFMKEAKTMMVTHPKTPNRPMEITVDQWPAFKMRGYHHAEQKENRMRTMNLIDKMKKASPAAKKALEAPSRVDNKDNKDIDKINKALMNKRNNPDEKDKDVIAINKKLKVTELTIADVRKATEKAKKRQEKERKATGKTSTSTTDLAARHPNQRFSVQLQGEDTNPESDNPDCECTICECNPCACGPTGGMPTADAEGLGEALDMKQRLARGRSARKNKAKMAMGRRRAGRRIASMKVLKKRAMRAARKTLTKRLTKGIAKTDLSVSRKREIEKRLDKPAFKIKANRLVKRTIKDIRKKEIARKRK